jgi:hypothetical protein
MPGYSRTLVRHRHPGAPIGLPPSASASRAIAEPMSPARELAIRCMRPGELTGCRARGVIDRRQPLGRCDGEHDRFGMVEHLAEGDGGCRRVGEKVGGRLGHLPELVWEKSVAGPASSVVTCNHGSGVMCRPSNPASHC